MIEAAAGIDTCNLWFIVLIVILASVGCGGIAKVRIATTQAKRDALVAVEGCDM